MNPLYKKLGLKAGQKTFIDNAPDHYEELLAPLPEGIHLNTELEEELDFVHFFTRERAELEQAFPVIKEHLNPAGIFWVSWPKGASSIETDLSGGVVREIGLRFGLVDVKVCAVDKDWSALKFMYRTKDRPK